jgi:hypothetical protein
MTQNNGLHSWSLGYIGTSLKVKIRCFDVDIDVLYTLILRTQQIRLTNLQFCFSGYCCHRDFAAPFSIVVQHLELGEGKRHHRLLLAGQLLPRLSHPKGGFGKNL